MPFGLSERGLLASARKQHLLIRTCGCSELTTVVRAEEDHYLVSTPGWTLRAEHTTHAIARLALDRLQTSGHVQLQSKAATNCVIELGKLAELVPTRLSPFLVMDQTHVIETNVELKDPAYHN